jgi:iron complex transport system ATP-binding protein
MAVMLALRGLTVGYAGERGVVLSGIDITVAPGAFICILGRNGAGKSTLMRTIAGLQRSLAGHVDLDGASVAAMRAASRARQIAVVLTERAFSPGLRVDDVVSLGRQPFTSWQGHLTANDRRIIDEALAQASVGAFRRRYFDDLSDGERQRVMIARAIAQTPRVMILDEITAFLDLPGRVEIMALLRRHARETRAAVLLSSHDLDLSLQLADEVWLVTDGAVKNGRAAALIERGDIASAFDTEDVAFSSSEQRFYLKAAPSSSERA